jgi:hypothetical protein
VLRGPADETKGNHLSGAVIALEPASNKRLEKGFSQR